MSTDAPTSRKDLERKPLADLHAIAAELGIPGYRRLRKADLVDRILLERGEEPGGDGEEPGAEVLEWPGAEEEEEAGDGVIELPSARRTEEQIASGVLDLVGDGFGFLRLEGYLSSRGDVYVSASQVRRFGLRPGDELEGAVRPPRRSEKHPALTRIESVNGSPAEEAAEQADERPRFEQLTAVAASEALSLAGGDELAQRVEAAAPLQKGGRVLLGGAQAAAALRAAGAAIEQAVPAIPACAILIGVPAEAVTAWRRGVSFDVVAAPFEAPDADRVQAAGLMLERAKRRAERGEDVVLLVDSLSALGRVSRDAVRALFGAGRRLEEGGSLTVVGVVSAPADPRSEGAELLEELRAAATATAELD